MSEPEQDSKTPLHDLASKLHEMGVKLSNQGKYAEADVCFREAIIYDAENPSIAINLIKNLYNHDKFDDAVKFVKQHFESRNKNHEFWSSYLNFLIGVKKFSEAEKGFKKLEKDPEIVKDAGFYFNYARCLLLTNRPRQAEEYFIISNRICEVQKDYKFLIACFLAAKTFKVNEGFMLERLLLERDSELSPMIRRFHLANFYLVWAETLLEEDPDLAKRKLYFAQEHAEQAADFAQISFADPDAYDHNLKAANELLTKINIEIQRLENGFEPPGLEYDPS